MATLDPPKFTERMRGSSAGRHPWFLLSTGGPPDLPPETIQTHGVPEPSDEDHCPACKRMKAQVCDCGYDWDNLEWVGRGDNVGGP